MGNVEIGCEQLLLALCEGPKVGFKSAFPRGEAKLEQSGAMQIISGGETRPLEAYVGGLGVSGEQLRATVLEELPESRSIHSF